MSLNSSPSKNSNSQALEISQENTISSPPQPKIRRANCLNSPSRNTKADTLIFRPLQARLYQGYGYESSVGSDLYCKIKLGRHSKKTSAVKADSGNPEWFEMISLQRKHNESFARITVRDKDVSSVFDGKIGKAKIPLKEVAAHRGLTQWYDLTKKGVVIGKILVKIQYTPTRSS